MKWAKLPSFGVFSRPRRRPSIGWWGWGLLALFVATNAWAEGIEVQAHRDGGQLLVDLSAEGLFDEKAERALRSGLPARVWMRVELWVGRSVIWDGLVTDLETESRVVFDLLDERYDVIDESGERVLSTEDLDVVRDWLSRIEDLPLCSVDVLDPERRHYVSVELRLQPLTAEEVRDLQRWLSGNLQRSNSTLERWTGQFFGVIRERIGLGRREWSGRSVGFHPPDLPTDARR